MSKTTKIRLGIGLAVLLVIGIGMFVNRNNTAVDDLQTGDCIETMPSAGEEFRNVKTVSCSEPHEGEITGVLSDSDVGGLALTAQIKCVDVSQAYAGSAVDVDAIFAISIQGSDGDIEGATCGIVSPEKVTTSFAGA